MKYPFEVDYEAIQANPDAYIDAVFSSLESEFLVLPKGPGFVDYKTFEAGYEALKQATAGFTRVTEASVLPIVQGHPISIIVLRTILGFTPPEWAYVTMRRTGVEVPQGFARSLDRDVRMTASKPISLTSTSRPRLEAMIKTACILLQEGAASVTEDRIHRLDKADTKLGLQSVQSTSSLGVPYAMLLYERFLGRPFAGHRDSVSELVGDALESAIEDALVKAGISYRKTKRAERIPNFDQAPDFIVPSEFNPKVILEAKLTEDDGTARDKVTRIQHLGELSMAGQPPNHPKYEVVACIAGRGFGVRREDMKKMILATRGKVFTLKTLNRLVDCTGLKEFRTR